MAIDMVPLADWPSAGLVHESNNRTWPAIHVEGEALEIPDRIYNDYAPQAAASLTPAARAAAGCIYTRHHDGHVRQRALALAVSEDVAWAAPFIVSLLGEYVVEICGDIEQLVGSAAAARPLLLSGLCEFAAANPAFLSLTRARAVSYWAAYHRWEFLDVGTYPAIRALDRIEAARLKKRP